MNEPAAFRDPATPPPLPVPAGPSGAGPSDVVPAPRPARAGNRPSPRRRMFVTVGTDHHPFERLVAWAERWAVQAGEDWEVHVQHGRTRPPRACVAFAFCDHDELQRQFAAADVVVSHGGPASITEARRLGHRPIAVARDPRLGEHVDDHQQLFVARLAASRLVERVDTEGDFVATVVASAYLPRQRTSGEDVPPGVFRVGRVAEQLVDRRRSAGRRR